VRRRVRNKKDVFYKRFKILRLKGQVADHKEDETYVEEIPGGEG
jgi:hypothetical protein